ncbi:MAG: glycine/sarcosine/betaine reductase selenoprotein B family protein [Acidimicrobiia bacterium]
MWRVSWNHLRPNGDGVGNKTDPGAVALYMPDETSESFDDFKNSFAYGSRNDLSFKFLKRLDGSEAAEFLSLVLSEVGELFDGAPPDRLIDLAYQWQVNAYQPKPGEKRPFTYDDKPFTPLGQELADITLGLVTSSGHFVADEDPAPFGVENMTQGEAIERIDDFLRATPELTAIPHDTPAASLRVRHPGYDIGSVSRDPGVAFPHTLLAEAAHEGLIGGLSDEFYSFVGACAQGRIRREAPGWVERWKAARIEGLLLVPV